MTSKLSKEQQELLSKELDNYGFKNISSEDMDVHYLLSQISISKIVKNIEEFRKINFRTILDGDLFSAVMKVLTININGELRSIYIPFFKTYPTNTKFYRVRRLKKGDNSIPYQTISNEQDLWNPPTEYVTQLGRLNKKHESLLYTSPYSPMAAINEMNIQEQEKFCLINYKAKAPIKAVLIGMWKDLPNLSDEENLKMRIYANFLNTEFTRDVGVGTEFLYRVSECITKTYFDYPARDVQDAWCYPSVKAIGQENVCFRPDIAKESLEFIGAEFCKIDNGSNKYKLTFDSVAFLNEKKQIIYVPINLEEAERLINKFKGEKNH